jgi:acyl carrier protein
MSDEFIQRICQVIANSQRIPIEKVTIESTFQDLGIDSMDAVNILFGLESEFDISIPDEDAKDIRTLRQMAEGVEKLVAAKAAGSAPAQ